MKGILRYFVAKRASRDSSNLDYTMHLFDTSFAGLKKISGIRSLLDHREAVSPDAAFAAQLCGALNEGCGSCVQVHIDMARGAGVSEAVIGHILASRWSDLPADAELACRFARTMIARDASEGDVRQEVTARWGDKGVLDLVLATQASRFFSMIKSGLGYATSCDLSHMHRPAAQAGAA